MWCCTFVSLPLLITCRVFPATTEIGKMRIRGGSSLLVVELIIGSSDSVS